MTYRLDAPSHDGELIPISVVHAASLLVDRTDPSKGLHEPAPCLLYGYGSYEVSIDPTFSPFRLSLLERGAIFAIAHIRGGGEKGRRWYDQGHLGAKQNSFDDFLAAADHLVNQGLTSPVHLVARGGSAGGLLMGAVANPGPERFSGIVAEVPFVDALNTMLDPTLPLTVGEYEEWGNPTDDPVAYATIASWAPYENLRSTRADGSAFTYPPMLLTGCAISTPATPCCFEWRWVSAMEDPPDAMTRGAKRPSCWRGSSSVSASPPVHPRMRCSNIRD